MTPRTERSLPPSKPYPSLRMDDLIRKSERDRIVAWLRSDVWGDWNGTYANDVLADRIEKGAHHA